MFKSLRTTGALIMSTFFIPSSRIIYFKSAFFVSVAISGRFGINLGYHDWPIIIESFIPETFLLFDSNPQKTMNRVI